MPAKKALPQAEETLMEGGHPRGRFFLLYLGLITEKDARCTFTDEMRRALEEHVKSCWFCQLVSGITADGILAAEKKKLERDRLRRK